MENPHINGEPSFFANIEQIIGHLDKTQLADVFRTIAFSPNEHYPMHSHERLEINYIKKGRCILGIENESLSFNEGQMMIVCSNVSHSFQAGSGGCTILQLEFLPDVLMSITDQMNDDLGFKLNTCDVFTRGNRVIKVVNNIGIMRAIQRIIAEMSSHPKYYKHLVLIYYAELLILIYRHLNESYAMLSTNDSITDALNYMAANYRNQLSIKLVAQHANISERYLRKLFEQYMNISPLDYLNQLRINRSIELLRITELSIKEISYECGFGSPQYFSRLFKQQVGVSPKMITKQTI